MKKKSKPAEIPTVEKVQELSSKGFSQPEIAHIFCDKLLFHADMFKSAYWEGKVSLRTDKINKSESIKSAEKLKRWRDKQREIEIPKVKDAKRRKEIEEQGLEAWLREYFSTWFPIPFSEDHKEMIAEIENCLRHGGLLCRAMPRGHGKTTILKGASIFAMALGLRKYIVPVLATGPLASSFLADVKKQLVSNRKLGEQYPELCACPEKCEDNAMKARSFMLHGKPLGFVWKKSEIMLPQFEGAACSGAIFFPVGITASFRGLQKAINLPDGKTEIVRPDFVLIDDPQTKETAQSETQTRAREEIIDQDILGLSGPNKKISGFMTVTVIHKGDLADKFLDQSLHPEWRGKKTQMIVKWPDEQDGLWAEYATIRKAGFSKGNNGKSSTEFYRENREKMDAGAIMSWAERKNPDDLSALQHAENLLSDRGDKAFASEYQNDPKARAFELYDISVRLVSHRINEMKRHEVETDVRGAFAFCDINFSALHWAMVGFRNDKTAFVLDYGKIPERGILVARNSSVEDQKRLIASGINQYFQQIAGIHLERDGKPFSVRAVGVDRGFHPETVHQVVRYARAPFSVFPCKGYGGSQYRPAGKHVVGKLGFECHVSESQFGQFFAANTDYFKEVTQRAFLVAPGSPGSLSFWGKHPEQHLEISEHVCAETLNDKAEGAKGTFWKWALQPGAVNDWLDALAGCYSLATWFLGDTSQHPTEQQPNQQRRPAQKRELRKPKVRIEE